MRLDKFLKLSRLSKRRTMARDLCHNELVTINGAMSKPSKEVKVGDVLEISVRSRTVKVRILEIPQRAPGKDDASKLYEVLEIRENPRIDPLDELDEAHS